MLSVIVGSISVLTETLSQPGKDQRNHINFVNEYFRARGVSKTLREEIKCAAVTAQHQLPLRGCCARLP